MEKQDNKIEAILRKSSFLDNNPNHLKLEHTYLFIIPKAGFWIESSHSSHSYQGGGGYDFYKAEVIMVSKRTYTEEGDQITKISKEEMNAIKSRAFKRYIKNGPEEIARKIYITLDSENLSFPRKCNKLVKLALKEVG